jgi:hypothetical protein
MKEEEAKKILMKVREASISDEAYSKVHVSSTLTSFTDVFM